MNLVEFERSPSLIFLFLRDSRTSLESGKILTKFFLFSKNMLKHAATSSTVFPIKWFLISCSIGEPNPFLNSFFVNFLNLNCPSESLNTWNQALTESTKTPSISKRTALTFCFVIVVQHNNNFVGVGQ